VKEPGMEINRATTTYDIPRKPNPRGKPRYRLSRVRLYGFAINQSRIKHILAEKTSMIIRIPSYIVLICFTGFICFMFL
jgi:hypothetical protein